MKRQNTLQLGFSARHLALGGLLAALLCLLPALTRAETAVQAWVQRYHGPGNGDDNATAVAVDSSNNVIVTGSSIGSGSSYDYATIKYSGDGVPVWTNGGGANAIAVNRSGSVIVTGDSGRDYATIKYIFVPAPVLTGLQPTNGTFQLRVDGVLQPGTLVIEASTDLAGWAPVFTNTTPTNVLFYTDPEAGSYLWRFCRAYQFP